MVQIPKTVIFYVLTIILSFNPYFWSTVDKFVEIKFKPPVKEEPTKLIIPNLFGPPPLSLPPQKAELKQPDFALE